ncbi:neutral/alkaline ceramidase [Rhodococcus sp. NCIMB 12038]|uniref:neutral/alkaline ceramidase n=1 Tax=Rhodococcus sp. NCIMB 12038 TaxID=933800 RepID=UPI000B3BE63D|nr:neutral/alkaline ceramidase [Rhodococcus sp. NCIMB 12038]OUS94375.1 alkaline ceramidase [Rhodococcus sp. NCIMB 12038]
MQIKRRSVLVGAALTPAVATLGSGRAAADPGTDDAGEFLVGVGISDATGPVAEVGMMGYSSFEQRAEGLHQRTRARAFVFAESGGTQRVVYVCADVCMIFQSVHDAVLTRLAQVYGDLYTERNVMLTAVHSHAACGGASHDYAYNLAVLGHNPQVFDAEVGGIVEAITAAHDSLAPGSLSYGRSELTDASVNRSRIAFDRNPAEDRDYYPLGIDTSMRVLRIMQGGRDVGAINWFPTHGASLTDTNHLISGDNKGAAAYFWEHDHEGVRYLDGTPQFVAAFPQTNTGDMSPNLDLRPGHGPTDDEFENTRIIGQRQVEAARTAWASASENLTGGVDSRIMYLDMANQEVGSEFTPDGRTYRTSPACVGAAMSAGSTEDGPAIPIFPEGTTNPLVDALGGMDAPIPQWLQDAQAPKLVLVAVGLLPPDGWVPHVLKIQILRIGGLYVVGGPAEFTIVAGLRIRRTVADRLGVPLENVIFQGYANSYASYCTTPQEYDAQQYEGGSTLFGRYTLPAYQQGFAALADALRTVGDVPRGPAPRDLSQFQPYFGPRVEHDEPPAGHAFGDILTQPASKTTPGQQVTVEFVTGHPHNNPRRGGTFLEIQRLSGDRWLRHADDGDWSTRYHWTRTEPHRSVARITWDIPDETPAGQYRVQHYGDSRDAAGTITPFTGTSNDFDVE